jgi:pentapeptide MXKDX repeat protein
VLESGARALRKVPGDVTGLPARPITGGDDAVERRTSQLSTRDPAMTVFSRTTLAIAALAVSFGLAVAPAALAQDTTSQGTMNKDTMNKDTMGKGSMSKDTMGKGSMNKKSKKDTMEKDTMGKNGMSKDNMSH